MPCSAGGRAKEVRGGALPTTTLQRKRGGQSPRYAFERRARSLSIPRRLSCGISARIRRSRRPSCLSIRRLNRKKGRSGTTTRPAAASSCSITYHACGASLVTANRLSRSFAAVPACCTPRGNSLCARLSFGRRTPPPGSQNRTPRTGIWQILGRPRRTSRTGQLSHQLTQIVGQIAAGLRGSCLVPQVFDRLTATSTS
jgi:hypothetical protein